MAGTNRRQGHRFSPSVLKTTFVPLGRLPVLKTTSVPLVASTFDAAGRRISVSDPLGKITSYTFDADGNETSVTDPNNLTTVWQYNYLGQLIEVTDPLSHSVQYEYNRAGELIVETDAKNQETTHAYDALGRRSSTTDRLNQTTTFAWNALGLQESLTDAESQTTSYVYDEYHRLYRTIYPDHVSGSNPGDAGYGITQTEYDSFNRVLRTTDQLGDTVTHTHDEAGRLLSRDYRTRANSPSGTIADSDSFTYDAASRMLTAVSGRYSNTVTLNYDAAGRKSTESLTISGQTYTSETQYDAAGRVSTQIYPDGSELLRTYTARGQLATLAVDSTTINTRTYDDGGRLISSSYNNGVGETQSYNDDNTLATISYSGAAIGDLSYTWDANKNKTSETIGGVMSGYGFSAGYDAEDRLISWDRSDTNLNQSWDLSPVGDWNSITENLSVQNRTHGPVHEILTAASQAVQHDPKGNMTLIPPALRPGSDPLKLKWDFDNKLRAADTDNDGVDDVFYRWDALGRRVGRDDGTTSVVYFQDGQQTLADYPAGAAAGSPTYTYVYASYIDEVVLRSGGSGTRYYHRNEHATITALTDGGGSIVERYAYTAYGQVTFADVGGTVQAASASNNRYAYTGREWDAGLALYHYRARMYDAVAGRFVSRDPIGYWDGLLLYANYASLFRTDPSGLATEKDGARTCMEANAHCGCTGAIKVAEYELATEHGIEGRDSLVGARINIEFHPEDKNHCDCDKVAFIQMVDVQPRPWRNLLNSPGVARPFIDPWPDDDNEPYYWSPMDPRTYYPYPEISDLPLLHRSSGNPNGSMSFETCAVCQNRGKADAVMGCVTWGFRFTRGQAASDELIPLGFQSSPSDKFLNALWTDHPNHDLRPCEDKTYIPPFYNP